ncbi:hypothetical protein M3484_18015 [Pseudomonas sp. GX19020]|uniref:hypothetical protein n=1 Tax=Pseudomonadota TaxID=1224 RepID=UPI00089C2DD8|nr:MULTISPECIES: hypothetical protein [Pseudomonadota]MCL4068466.1 hypothetical protein [Pseudomonas sp. GX19020]SED19499.1 hypothetical protein SAMN05519105_3581 [Rhodobacter sp. 24-YEA-8]
MVALVVILSGLAALAASVLVWFLDGGIVAVMMAYVISGNLCFALLSGLAGSVQSPEAKPDFTSAIEADLQALLEERLNKTIRNQAPPRKPRFPLLRRSGVSLPGSAKVTRSARTRTLFH